MSSEPWITVSQVPAANGAVAPDAARVDIVFFHGLWSDADSAWRSKDGPYWPQQVADTHAHIGRVWVVNFPAEPFKLFRRQAQKQPGLQVLCENVLSSLKAAGLGQRPAIWVCHSLGGLLAKRMLLSARALGEVPNTLPHESVVAVLFLGTPHAGSSIASLMRTVGSAADQIAEWGPLLVEVVGPGLPFGVDTAIQDVVKHGFTATQLIEELEKGSPALDWLKTQFSHYHLDRIRRRYFSVTTFRETERMGPTLVVDADSADPHLCTPQGERIPVLLAQGCDHGELAKPGPNHAVIAGHLDGLIRDVAVEEHFSPLLFVAGKAQYARPIFDLLLTNQRAGRWLWGALLPKLSRPVAPWGLQHGHDLPDAAYAKHAATLAGALVSPADGGPYQRLQQITSVLDGPTAPTGFSAAELDALRELAGVLLVHATAERFACFVPPPLPEALPEFLVPSGVSDLSPDALEQLLELGHARLRHSPARFSYEPLGAGQRGRLLPQTNRLSMVAVQTDTVSMEDIANEIDEVVDARDGTHFGPTDPGEVRDGRSKHSAAVHAAAKAQVRTWLVNDGRGLVLDARQVEGNALAKAENRNFIYQRYDNMIAVAMDHPVSRPEQQTELARFVGDLSQAARDFLRRLDKLRKA